MVPLGKTVNRKFQVKPGGFKPKWIVVHHSFSSDGEIRNWDAIRKYHMSYRSNGNIITEEEYNFKQGRGEGGLQKPWADIGYHFGIENVNGKLEVLTGRLIGESGAHATGKDPYDFNKISVGICLIGNYDNDPPSEDRLKLVASLCRQLQLEYGIPRDQVIGHRETFVKRGVPVEKSCPGRMFDMEAFRSRLRA